ncbi:hypothetical protein LJC48_07045, partial [Desulfovibrio sp. OttesenSCG-928-C06]|nr:hypothetical protein [Desulfovibrio sp. OttesenSCG-928-C06]
MSHLTQLMESGIDNDKWREIITPHTDPEVTTSYLVSFAEVSWDLQGEPNFVDLDSGGQKLKELILAAPFGNRTLAAIFEGLKEFSLAPSLVGSESLSDDQPADERWEVAENALEQAANNGEGMVLFIFSSDNLLVSLTLDLDSSTAVIGLALPE